MFWTLLAFVGLAAVFVKLGAYSVWIAIYSLGFKFGVFVLLGLVLWSIFRHTFSRNSGK